jgi:hypothetical protein
VSELAPGVNGMTMLIGRDDSSSAPASVIAIGLAVRDAARMMDALDIRPPITRSTTMSDAASVVDNRLGGGFASLTFGRWY